MIDQFPPPQKKKHRRKSWRNKDSIANAARTAFRANLSNEEALVFIKQQFPDANTTLSSVRSMRNNFRKNGERVPGAREARKERVSIASLSLSNRKNKTAKSENKPEKTSKPKKTTQKPEAESHSLQQQNWNSGSWMPMGWSNMGWAPGMWNPQGWTPSGWGQPSAAPQEKAAPTKKASKKEIDKPEVEKPAKRPIGRPKGSTKTQKPVLGQGDNAAATSNAIAKTQPVPSQNYAAKAAAPVKPSYKKATAKTTPDNIIAIASDHAGFELKNALKTALEEWGFTPLDLGTDSSEGSVDYPDYAQLVAQALAWGDAGRGILICGSGIGISIAANRYRHIRAALCHDSLSARLARQHNNANVLVFGAKLIGAISAKECLAQFLSTEYEGGRHQQRIDKIS